MSHPPATTERAHRIARLVAERIRARHPTLEPEVRISEECAAVALPVPAHAGHELRADVYDEGATLAYDDGQPPGPAERILVWGSEAESFCAELISRHIEAVLDGRVALVRERLSGWVRMLRRKDCDSLLGFVPAEELERWSVRRRRQALDVWTWSGPIPPSTRA